MPPLDGLTAAAADGGARAALATALDVLFENATIGLGVFDSDLRVVRVNPRLAEINGLPAAAHVGRRLEEILAPAEVAPVVGFMRAVLETGEAVLGVEVAGFGPQGYRIFQCDYHPLLLTPGRRGVVAVVTDVTAERMAARRIAESEQKLRHVLDAALAYVGVIDLDGRVALANAPALRDAGLNPEDTIGRPLEDTYWFSWSEDVRDRAREAVRRALAGAVVRYSETLRFGPEARRRLIIQITPVPGPDGRVAYLVPTGTDVTELAEAQERQELLTAELNHRVKNILSVVRALVRQTARRSPTKEALAEALEGRIGAMARSVALLTRANWAGYDLRGILQEQVDHLFGERVSFSGPPTPLNPKATLAFALIGYELMSNAAKYGALSQPGGWVEATWALKGERLVWRWRERGGPRVTAPKEAGFGSALLRSVAQGDLDAELFIEYAPDGVVVRLDMPRERVERRSFIKAAAPSERPLGGMRVLIVEESAIVAMDMAAALEGAGAAVVGPFFTAREALAALEGPGAAPHLAFVAARLAAEQDWALARALAAHGAEAVAIAGANARDLPASMAVLRKPFGDVELIEAAQRAAAGA